MMIAGAVGRTAQAVEEAHRRIAGLSCRASGPGAFTGASEDELVAHCGDVAQRCRSSASICSRRSAAARCGLVLGTFCAIENVIGIKVAPFNRYATLDVIHGVAAAEAAGA